MRGTLCSWVRSCTLNASLDRADCWSQHIGSKLRSVSAKAPSVLFAWAWRESCERSGGTDPIETTAVSTLVPGIRAYAMA